MTPTLFDMHCHLGFCNDAAQAASELAACGVGAFSNTVTPAEFVAHKAALSGMPDVRVGVGLHPWWVDEDGAGATCGATCGLDELRRLVATNRFVGEVGLDFSPRHVATREAQLQVFETVARTCAEAGGKVLSIHAVRAVDDVLDALEDAGALAEASGNACVIHWFSGTSDQLTRARRAGCLFSVNPRMLTSKRGRAYAQVVPADHLLLETDEPASAGASWSAERIRQLLADTLQQLAQLRGDNPDELGERVAATSRQLLGCGA